MIHINDRKGRLLPVVFLWRSLLGIMEKQYVKIDNPDEVFDLVDEKDRVIGRVSRKDCHQNPDMIHRAVHVLVFNSKRELFLQKRSLLKDINPGMWGLSVSGHVDAGETYAQTAIRETKEEIGAFLSLKYLDTCFLKLENESEFSAIFITEAEGPFELNSDEIEDGGFFSLDDIQNRLWDEIAPASQMVFDHVMKRKMI